MSNISKKKEKFRLDYIDICKGFGILLMVLGHIPVSKTPMILIYSFHMPLFFILSGLLVKSEGNSLTFTSIKRKFQKLLIPYAFFFVPAYVLWFIELKPQTLNHAMKPLVAAMWDNTNNMPIAGALWFLPSLLWCSLLFAIIHQKHKNPYVIAIQVMPFVLFGFFMEVHYKGVLPWAFGISSIGLLFYFYGYLLKHYLQLLSDKYSLFLLLLSCLTAPLILSNGLVSMRTGTFHNIFLFIYGSVLFGTTVIVFSYKLSNSFLNQTFVIKLVKQIGEGSIVYLCLNEIFINIYKAIFNKLGLSSQLILLFAFAGTIISLFICERIFMKTKLKGVLGKK